MSRWATVFCCLIVMALCLAYQPPAAAQQAPAGATLFEGARLIVGDGTPAIEDSAFLVVNDKFVSVGKRGEISLPAGGKRVDLTGKTVTPMFVTLHAHVGYEKDGFLAVSNYTRENIQDQLNRYAYYGFAAIMSTGTDPGDMPYEFRNKPHPGAMFRLAGRGFGMPNASTGVVEMRGAPYGVTTEDEARKDVRELAGKGPDFVKIWVDDRNGTVPKLTPVLYKAIIDEAHKHQLRVMAHEYYLADAHALADAGVQGFLHSVRDAEMDDALVQEMKQKNMFITPNLASSERAEFVNSKPGWLYDPALAETVPPNVIKKVAATYDHNGAESPVVDVPPANPTSSYAKQQRSLAKMNAAGVTIAIGGDVGIAGTFYGFTEHHEMELYVRAGMKPMQVIVAATSTPARLLRLTQLGTVAAGKSASFVVLNANPLDNIANTKKIAAVYQNGKALDRAAMSAAWVGGAKKAD